VGGREGKREGGREGEVSHHKLQCKDERRKEGGREGGRAYRVIPQGEQRVERAERGLDDGHSDPGPEGAGSEAAGMDAWDVELRVLGR